MTPKEKAEELIQRFSPYAQHNRVNAIQCAEIVVNEQIRQLTDLYKSANNGLSQSMDAKFTNAVSFQYSVLAQLMKS